MCVTKKIQTHEKFCIYTDIALILVHTHIYVWKVDIHTQGTRKKTRNWFFVCECVSFSCIYVLGKSINFSQFSYIFHQIFIAFVTLIILSDTCINFYLIIIWKCLVFSYFLFKQKFYYVIHFSSTIPYESKVSWWLYGNIRKMKCMKCCADFREYVCVCVYLFFQR